MKVEAKVNRLTAFFKISTEERNSYRFETT